MKTKFLATMAIMFLLPLCANATDIYDDTIIDSGFWPDNTNVYNTAILTVEGGDIVSISAYDSSTIDIFGGQIGTIYLYELESATVNLYGGEIVTGFHGQFGTANAVNIYGYDFTEWQNGDNAYLSGKWDNNSYFEFYFLRSDGLPDIVSLHIIPEPGMLSLFGFGVLIMRRKVKHFYKQFS